MDIHALRSTTKRRGEEQEVGRGARQRAAEEGRAKGSDARGDGRTLTKLCASVCIGALAVWYSGLPSVPARLSFGRPGRQLFVENVVALDRGSSSFY